MKANKKQKTWFEIQSQLQKLPIFEPVRDILSRFSHWPDVNDMNSLWQTTHPLVTLTFESEIFSDEIRSAPQKTKNQFNLDGFIHNIHNHRRVFTRSESMHDLFNFMTFLMFPMTKLKIFELHCQESIQFSKDLEKSRGGRGRTRLQDLPTLFEFEYRKKLRATPPLQKINY